MAEVLVVDDEQSMREFIAILLRKEGHEVTVASSITQGSEIVRARAFDLLVSDLRLPDGSGLDLLKLTKELRPEMQVIIVTAFATMENAIEAMRLGAYDYQLKPFKLAEIRMVIAKALEKGQLIRENRALKAELKERYGLDGLIGKSASMRQIYALVEKVAPSRSSVIVMGESGTGKELVARAIHHLSERAGGPFVAINCGAIPEALMESEFFGHKKGAFTGAVSDREGLFEAAARGTLFLDEIGELPSAMQVKLLRVLQERVVKRVGATEHVEVDVRVVAATNRDLQAEVKAGRFREDLFYRLNVIQIRLPPLRERKEDVALLVEHFLKRISHEQKKTVEGFTPEAMKIVLDHSFPGNVRELENLVERAVTLADSALLGANVLPPNMTPHSALDAAVFRVPEAGLSLEKTLDAIELKLLTDALERSGGVKKKAAELLGLTFRSMRYRLQKHALAGEKDDELEDAADA